MELLLTHLRRIASSSGVMKETISFNVDCKTAKRRHVRLRADSALWETWTGLLVVRTSRTR